MSEEKSRELARRLLAAAQADMRDGVPLAQRLEDAAPAVLGRIETLERVRLAAKEYRRHRIEVLETERQCPFRPCHYAEALEAALDAAKEIV